MNEDEMIKEHNIEKYWYEKGKEEGRIEALIEIITLLELKKHENKK